MRETLALSLVPFDSATNAAKWDERSDWSINGEPAELGVRRVSAVV